MIEKRVFALALAMSAIAAACGGSAAEPSAAPAEPTAETTAAPDEAAPAGLEGEFATIGGASIDLATLQGEDVVLWFWAPW